MKTNIRHFSFFSKSRIFFLWKLPGAKFPVCVFFYAAHCMLNRFCSQKINNASALFCKFHFVGEKARRITIAHSGSACKWGAKVHLRVQMRGVCTAESSVKICQMSTQNSADTANHYICGAARYLLLWSDCVLCWDNNPPRSSFFFCLLRGEFQHSKDFGMLPIVYLLENLVCLFVSSDAAVFFFKFKGVKIFN